MSWWEQLRERDLAPDWLIRAGIRQLLRQRESEAGEGDWVRRKDDTFAEWRAGAVAVHTRDANLQHYEVPTRFYELVLGPHRKYSCALYPTGNETLA